MTRRVLLSILLVLMVACRSEPGEGAKDGLRMKTETSLKAPSFSDYPIPPDEIFKEAPAAPDPATSPMARRYRMAIEKGMRRGVNFAGHYVLVDWGCGASCQQSAVVDAITGRVYPGPESSYGYDFKRDSRLLITNPPDPNRRSDPDSSVGRTEYWLWQTGGLKRIDLSPTHPSDEEHRER